MRLVTRLVPPITREQVRNGILHSEEVLHSEGMTAVKDPLIEQIEWDASKSLLDEGKLKERICVLWSAGSSIESAKKALNEINSVRRIPETYQDRLLSCGVKDVMDGSGGARTGWVYDDWLRNGTTPDVTSAGTANRGYPQTDPQIYLEDVDPSTRTKCLWARTQWGIARWIGWWIRTRWSRRSTRCRDCDTALSTPTCQPPMPSM